MTFHGGALFPGTSKISSGAPSRFCFFDIPTAQGLTRDGWVGAGVSEGETKTGGLFHCKDVRLEVMVTIVRKLVYFNYLRGLQPSYIRIIIHLLSASRTSQWGYLKWVSLGL